ncbi:signal peptidase I [Anoxybacillus kestanbolensis]|uniref:signal peptidase I n=1 Tax=Anoxybacillus kestanbolensis TaxID=227476 RepID=UPI00208DB2A1|nr:signal peptidase I [Anoxybacillus kestanbolensis]MCL9969188.1 signal peptidase I [Anoxybacillus kestanbolensis]
MRKVLGIFFASLLFFSFVCIFYFIGWRGHIVLTDSMKPTIPKGSLVITKPIIDQRIENKIIVFYYKPLNTYVMHRVNEQKYSIDENTILIQTKGDANKVKDPISIKQGDIKGVYVTHVPFVGFVIKWIKTYTVVIGLLIAILYYKRLYVYVIVIFVCLFPMEGYASFQKTYHTSCYVATGSGFFFYYLLNSTDTKQPSNPQVNVSTGQNATLTIDVGTVSGVVNFQTTISNAFTITNKTRSSSNLTLSIQNVDKPPLSLVGINYIVSVPSSAAIPSGQTFSIPLQINFLPLLTISGVYRGAIVISDTGNEVLFQVPIIVRVQLI